jgi:hypothetical protein
MRVLPLLPAILGICLLSASGQSQPEPRCDAAYLDGFDIVEGSGASRRVTWDTPEIECVEYFRFSVTTPGGSRIFRGIGDVNLADALRPGDISRIESGARRAADELASLGDYQIANVTILMSEVGSDPFSEEIMLPGGRRKHAGAAAWTWVSDATPRGECPVTLFVMNRFDREDLQYTTAHEIFHCVQYASLRPQQMWSRALWWIEGSADLFAAMVVADKNASWDRAPEFRAAVEAQRPLYAMDYEAAVFFYWYYQHNGAAALMPFLRSMATSSSDSAQRSAIRTRLNDDAFIDFAKAFDDGQIRYPDGEALDFGAKIDGIRWAINTTSTQRATLKPFVIMPGWTDYQCGLWGNRISPDRVNLAVREEDSTDWNNWPAETDCRERGSIRYRTVAMHSGDTNAALSLRAERRIACENCLDEESVIDMCLVGSWEQTGGGPWEWLKDTVNMPITRDQVGRLRITLNDDGTLMVAPVNVDVQFTERYRGHISQGTFTGQIRPAAGRWSARENRIKACFDSGGAMQGTLIVRGDNNIKSGPFSAPGAAGEEGSARYSCTDATLRTEVSMPRGGTLWYEFRRITPRRPTS